MWSHESEDPCCSARPAAVISVAVTLGSKDEGRRCAQIGRTALLGWEPKNRVQTSYEDDGRVCASLPCTGPRL